MSNSGSVEVVVVDDNLGAAETFRDLIESTTGLHCVATDDPDGAVAIVTENAVVVAVLDQNMPRKKGTELFRELRRVEPKIAGIMLTGEAEISEVIEGYDLGFTVLDKKNVELLPNRVRDLYYKELAHRAIPDNFQPVELMRPRVLLGFRRTPGIRLVGYQIIEADYIDGNWSTYLQLTSGEKRTYSGEFTVKRALSLVQSSKITLGSLLGAKGLGILEARLSGSIVEDATKSDAEELVVAKRIEITYELPAPSGSAGVYIQARNYQVAPSYRRLRINLAHYCGTCGQSGHAVAVAVQATGRFATRQEEFLSDGARKDVRTGYI